VQAAVGAMTELPVYDEVKRIGIEQGIVEEGFQSHIFSALCAGSVPFRLRIAFAWLRVDGSLQCCNLCQIASMASSRGLYFICTLLGFLTLGEAN
jgi:hypothetical protein